LFGLIAHRKGNLTQAIDYLNRSLLCDRSNPVTWYDLGDLQLAAGNLGAGIASYQEALNLRPDFADAYHNMGVALARATVPTLDKEGLALKGQGSLADAAEAFLRALKLQPDNPETAYNLGLTHHRMGDLDRAVFYYRKALALRPEYVGASANLATILKEQGSLKEAIAQFQQTLKLQPGFALGYYNLSEFVGEGLYDFTPEELDSIRKLLASSRSSSDKILCSFALAKALNKQGLYDEAFHYYKKGNDLKKRFLEERNVAFDAAKHEAMVDRIITTYDEAYFQRVQGWGVDTDLPVFIIGMPRSGSTLVEQILASHPQVFGAGELGAIPRLITNLAADAHAALYVAPVLPDQAAAGELAAAYLKRLTALAKGAARLTIKTLENFLHLGVIATIFPRARIIHCQRDPLDVCLSCYFQHFNDELVFTWALEDIGAYFRLYQKLMSHWARVLPLPIHEVRYEELVQRQEAVSRNMVAFCGLDWDERCLAFFDLRRVVRTASSVQVRKPMSSRALGRWQNYRDHLGPLFRELEK
jgi:tetratricopeptide (TPR) repeat protein